jgi:hypothetical protein
MRNRSGRPVRLRTRAAAIAVAATALSGTIVGPVSATGTPRTDSRRPATATITGRITDSRCIIKNGSVTVHGSFRFNVTIDDTNPDARYTVHYRLIYFKRDLNGNWVKDFTQTYDTPPWPYRKIDGIWEDTPTMTVTPVTWSRSRVRLHAWVERITDNRTRTVAELTRGTTTRCR